MIRHHPSDATLTVYAGGTMPEALGLVVAAHLYGCAVCRQTRAMAEAVGGAVMDALPPTPMTDDALALVLARAERPWPATKGTDRPTSSSPDLFRGPQTAQFRDFVPRGVAGSSPAMTESLPPPLSAYSFGLWRRIGPGLRLRRLIAGERGIAGLLEAMPGKVLPLHSHTGLELTCVLHGSFIDGADRYAAGDLAEVDEGQPHRPEVHGSEPCLCIIATEGIRLHGMLGVAQRLLGR
jgi:putative transcriptional regulator